MHLIHLALLAMAMAAATVRSDTVFQRPPGPGPNRDYRDDPIYKLGDEIDMIWEMDFEQANIVVWQQDINSAFGDEAYYAEVISKSAIVSMLRLLLTTNHKENTKSTRYTWKFSYDAFTTGHDPTLSNVYFFQLSDSAGQGGFVTSHYFNITNPKSKTTSMAETKTHAETRIRTRTSASKVAAQTVTETEEVTTETSTWSDNEDSGNSLSTGAIAGIAVGVTICGILILGGLGLLLWKRLRGGARAPESPGSSDDDKEVVTVSTTPNGQHAYHQPYPQNPQQEQQPEPQLQQVGGLHEAPAERYL
ncbi:hypothetical protein FSARC_3077 [Fusarium sarcochroum]|uniref:Mid2 domain-containing protein n=1 Tax=Fusarium sarcochroum TaxID=1208366 RepID=A0A8H4U558_9HYPO|nr:hypothetical protein FSARC_3077 [Fusarium sarcochroum]